LIGSGHVLTRAQHTSGNKKLEDDANKDTEGKLGEIQKIGKSKGSKVVDDLLKAVVDVHLDPEEH
jgi:V-type H+-transporting ATPase subunit G